MKTFTQPMQGLKEFEDLEAALPKLSGVIQISGCIDAAKPHMMYSIGNGSGNRIIVTFQEQKAKELAEEYRFFDPNAAYYPAKDILLTFSGRSHEQKIYDFCGHQRKSGSGICPRRSFRDKPECFERVGTGIYCEKSR